MKRLYVLPPAYAIQHPQEKSRVVKLAHALCTSLNWVPVFSPLLDRHPGPGVWLPADARAAELQRAAEHEAVWGYRGGYGSIHLLPTALALAAPHRPLLIGFSDVTVLHACWRQKNIGPGIYGTIPETLENTRAGVSLLDILHGRPWRRDGTLDESVRVLRPGRTEGVSFAACLTVLAGLCGTPGAPALEGAVLFVEDVDEKPYNIDFALNQLQLSGALKGLRALVGGSFKHQANADYWGPTVDEILRGWGDRLNIPVLTRLPFGHWDDALAVPQGARIQLEADASGRWNLHAVPA